MAAHINNIDSTNSLKSEDIIGEERVGDGLVFAERMIQEAERMWSSSGWKQESTKGGVLVESKPVSGVFESANILVMRSSGEVDAPAQAVFDFLVSPAGFAILDPVSNPEDHHLPPLEIYPWKENGRLEAAVASVKAPMMAASEFVVLNAIDSTARIFVSKSIIHDARPGGSRFSNEPPVPGAKPRALNTFGVKTQPINENKCQLQLINYVDMGVKGPSWIYNFINRRFFAPVYRRLVEEMGKN